jgi:hypothetical protein
MVTKKKTTKEEKRKLGIPVSEAPDAKPPRLTGEPFTPAPKPPVSGEGLPPIQKELPEPDKPTGNLETTDTGIGVFRDVESGGISGFRDPRTGKVFFGANAQDVEKLDENLRRKIGGVSRQRLPGDIQQERKLSQLEQQQIQEQEEFRRITTGSEVLSAFDRNVAAGLAFFDALAVSLGISKNGGRDILTKEEIDNLSFIQKKLFALTGAVGTAGVNVGGAKISVSSLISTSSTVKNLQSDAKSEVRLSSAQLTFALTRSPNRPKSNIDQAINNARQSEENIQYLYDQAKLNLKLSPEDIKAGLDLTNAMRADLGIAQENRRMLERYRVTGDSSEIMNAVNGQINLGGFADETA